jgi:plasmid maintenance system antidote protein VapI
MNKLAKADGKTELADKLQLEYNQKKDMWLKMRHAVKLHTRPTYQPPVRHSNPDTPLR